MTICADRASARASVRYPSRHLMWWYQTHTQVHTCTLTHTHTYTDLVTDATMRQRSVAISSRLVIAPVTFSG